MLKNAILLISLVLVAKGDNSKLLSENNKHVEPMVAITCSKSEKTYITQWLNLKESSSDQLKWAPDTQKSTCTQDKLEVLKICQRLYPDKDVTNIVESTKNLRLGNVCRVSGKQKIKCYRNANEENNTVFYRCLESPFQSDALLVPSPCIFDHIHNASNCLDSRAWNVTAYKSCNNREMNLKSYAVLLPCGVGLFTGVEFVCCPGNHKQISVAKETPVSEYNDEEYDDEDEEEDDEDEEDLNEEDYLDNKKVTTTTTTTTTTPSPPTIDPYFTHFNALNEHANYKQAESRLENVHRLRMSKVMHDWQELEKKYQEMRNSGLDKEAEDFKRTVTVRFQKTIKALEEESEAEKRQLVNTHQQRVLSHINERKKESMECYTQSLNEQSPSPNRVRKCLEKLMRILHKDRHHTLSHYRHLLKSNPKQGQIEEEYTLQRLTQISQTARQAIKMLQRYPTLTSTLKPLIEDYVLSLQGRDDPPGSLLTATHETEEILLKKYKNMITVEASSTTAEPVENNVVTNSESSSSSSPTTTMPTTTSTIGTSSSTTMDNDVLMNDEEASNKQTRKEFAQEQIISVRREVYHYKENKPIYFTMAFAGIAILGAIVIGLVVMKRRMIIGSPRNQGFLEVNTQSQHSYHQITSPEEKHVANMQINGYENPTYKYFEQPPADKTAAPTAT